MHKLIIHPIGFCQFSFLLAAAFQGKASELQGVDNVDFTSQGIRTSRPLSKADNLRILFRMGATAKKSQLSPKKPSECEHFICDSAAHPLV